MFEEGVFSDTIDNKYNIISENVSELISIVDHKYKIEYINKTPHLNILGYTVKDLIGNSWLQLVHQKDHKIVREILNLNSSKLLLKREISLICKNSVSKRFFIDVRAFTDYNKATKLIIFLKPVTKLIDSREIERRLHESEEMFRTITEQSLMGIVILQNNRIQYVNKTAAQMVGFTPNEILNFPIGGYINFIHPEDRKMVISIAKKRQKGKDTNITEYECRGLKKNGDIIWLKIYSKTIKYYDEYADLITLIDISDKKKAEIKSEYSELKLQYLLSSNPTVIYKSRIDRDRLFTFVSDNIREMTGYVPEDFIKKSNFWNSRVHPDDKNKIQLYLGNLSHRDKLGIEYRFKFKDGIYHWIQDEFKIIKDKRGIPLEMIGSWIDVTINKKIEEKMKYQAKLVDSISDAIISTDLDFNIITWNKAAEKIYGWKSEDVKRKKIEEIVPIIMNSDNQGIILKNIFEFGKLEGEIVQPRKDGKLINILASISVIKDTFGNPIGTVAITRDISDRKLNEQRLKESEEKFRSIAEQSLIGIQILQDNKTKYVNRRWAEISGYSVEEILNWDLEEHLEFIHPNDRDFIMHQLIKKQRGDRDAINHYQTRCIKKTGDTICVEVFAKSIKIEGKFADFIMITDITDRINVQKNLKEKNLELKRMNQLKSEFLRRASHELKTPLIAIKGFSNLLIELYGESFDSDILSYLEDINYGCHRLETLIIDLIKASQFDSSKGKIHKSKEDISFLIKFCVNELRGFAKSRNQNITLNLHNNFILRFDKEQIYEVFTNILSNSIKYTPPNGNINICTEMRDGYMIISIEDNGIGITDEEKTYIFKQFGKIERYGKGYDVISEGTGLGLYISKKIIELHGGNIWVESNGRDKGSTFYFSLPIED